MSKAKIIEDALTYAFQQVASEALADWVAGVDGHPPQEPAENAQLRAAAKRQLAGQPDTDALAFAALEGSEKLIATMEVKLERQIRFLWISLISIAILVFAGILAILVGSLFSVTGSLATGVGSATAGMTYGGLITLLYGQPWRALIDREKALDLARAKNVEFLAEITSCKGKEKPVACIKAAIQDYQQWRRALD